MNRFTNIYGEQYIRWLKVITASLLFTLIPLHKPELAPKFFVLANDVIGNKY